MNPQLVIDIPYTTETIISSRARKYVTCLQMAHRVISRELCSIVPLSLFNQLGIVAGFIDQHLDSLELRQQKVLVNEYDALFTTIWEIDHYLIFKNEICQFVERQNFHFHCDAIHLKDLFLFMQHAKSENMKDELKTFGKSIIKIAIAKQEATKSQELINLLRKEGNAVIDLLRALLRNEYGQKKSFEPTLKLLQELEHILNVADDTLDTRSDQRNNLISKSLGPLHLPKMLGHLTAQILKTTLKHPSKIAYYGPTLTWYYFSKTIV